MQKKYTKQLLNLGITSSFFIGSLSSCSIFNQPDTKPSITTSAIVLNTNYQDESSGYLYCQDDSCPEPTKFTINDIDDNLPDVFMPSIVIPESAAIAQNKIKWVVNFEFNSAKLTKNSLTLIDKRVKLINNKEVIEIIISGYTDNIKDKTKYKGANNKLAAKRAKVIGELLVLKYGFNKAVIIEHGKALCCYVKSNNHKQGRFANRRAVIEITTKNIKSN